jgi:hypothetical protein
MKFTTIRRVAAVILTAGLSLAMTGSPASADRPTRVDFTVSETLPLGTPGDLSASDVPGCESGTVTTPDVDTYERGRRTTFTGTKLVDCGDGDSFTMWFAATGVECRETIRGFWVLVGGTGSFDGAWGAGRLTGDYVSATGGQGDFCDNAGVDDRYTGRIRLAG